MLWSTVHTLILSCNRLSTLQLWHNCKQINRQQPVQPFSSVILCDSSILDSHPPHSFHPSVEYVRPWIQRPWWALLSTAVVDWDGWAEIVKGVDDTWLYVSEGTGGAVPEIACFSLSLWTWPFSQLYTSCSRARQVSSFLLTTFLSDLALCS